LLALSLDCNEAVRLDPKYAPAYQNRGLVRSQEGDLDGAIADYNEAIRLDPKFTAAYVSRGWTRFNRGDGDQAIVDYNQAIELDSKFVLAYTDRAWAKYRKGDYEGATMDLNRVIELDPNNAQAYANRATIRYISRDLNGASTDYREAIRFDPKLVYPRFYIWLIKFRQQSEAQANEELAAYLDKEGGVSREDWTTKIGMFLLDKIGEADFLAAASSPDTQKDRNQHCEAWYYAAMKRLFAGDKKTASDYFDKCLGTQVTGFNEYIFAQTELKALGAN
jgi:lipoprotein NlpI